MDIGNLIRDMALLGYGYHFGSYSAFGGYSLIFSKNLDGNDKQAIEFHKNINNGIISFAIDIYDNEGDVKTSEPLTIEKFHKLFIKIMASVHAGTNLSDINLEPSEN